MPVQTLRPAQPAAPTHRSFRPELQGLRALAVGLVVIYHLWPDRLSGGFVGVDVFFVISGFLITGHLYRELSNTGTIELKKFWARRAMRLLPLAFTVLAVSVVALLFFVPQTVWEMNVRQMLGALLYVENWVLAADSVNYMAENNEPSMVQHYWSLSIEEQFYILLPILLLGVYLLIKRIRRNHSGPGVDIHKVFIATLGTLLVGSFILSVVFTDHSAAQAYFITPTRFWEFAAGGLLAMLPAATRLPHRVQNLLGWAGVACIVVAGFAFSSDTPFPGYTALLPVVGALLFMRYGAQHETTGVYWWASRQPALRIGDYLPMALAVDHCRKLPIGLVWMACQAWRHRCDDCALGCFSAVDRRSTPPCPKVQACGPSLHRHGHQHGNAYRAHICCAAHPDAGYRSGRCDF
ncbi:MAG: acyltransferase [Micrococcaceae bacterium]|nr:acyltransferase [Micrococcaceae bacterium]